jgi:hypothetical protein
MADVIVEKCEEYVSTFKHMERIVRGSNTGLMSDINTKGCQLVHLLIRICPP